MQGKTEKMGAPAEAQRSGFGGERRSKGAGEVFVALGRKRNKADFATTQGALRRARCQQVRAGKRTLHPFRAPVI